MEFRILGPLEVADGRELLPLGGRRQRMVLAVLLLNPDQVVSTDRLIDDVWGEQPPASARKSLQAYISRLRAVLGGHVLETRSPGYVFQAKGVEIDARRFTELVKRGREALETDPGRAATAFREALALWRGAPLADVSDAVSLRTDITRLEEQRLVAIEDRIEADLRLGRHGAVVGELESLVGRYPFRERLAGELMLALYRSGRQAEALRAYQGTRKRLTEELGIDPSPELQKLEDQVLIHDATLAFVGEPEVISLSVAANPYKGLRAFTESDSADFYGREDLIERMLDRLGRSPFLAVIGPSGCGKSSAVRAGLVPALESGALEGSRKWRIATMLPGARPFDGLSAALAQISPKAIHGFRDEFRGDDLDLLRASLRAAPPDGEIVLVIDQFEELFSLVEDEPVQRRFVANLIEALEDPNSRFRLVVTLRADFYDRPLRYPALAWWLGRGQITVTPLSPGDLARAAEQPATGVGVGLELDLAAQLVSDVADQPGALPLFQYTLTELFERRDGPTITLEAYRRFGGLEGALRTRAEEIFGSLGAPQQELARQVFLRLVQPGEGAEDTRRRAHRNELENLGPKEMVATLLDRFGAARLLSFDRDPLTGDATVELAHEALLTGWPRLAEWIDATREELRLRRALATESAEWNKADRHSDYLLAGARLALYEEQLASSEIRLSEEEQSYLEASLQRRSEEEAAEAARQDRELRLERRAAARLRILAVVLSVAAVAAAMLAVFAVSQQREADRQRNAALLSEAHTLAQSLSYASVANIAEDPQLSLLLALHAVDITGRFGEPIPRETVEALHWAFQESGGTYPLSDGPATVLTSPTGGRGVFILPIDQLVSRAHDRVDRSLSQEECAAFFTGERCPQLPAAMPGPLTEAEPLVPSPLAGSTVAIETDYFGPQEYGILAEIARFTEKTGIKVVRAPPIDLESGLPKSLAAGDFPDVSVLTQPGTLPVLVEAGVLVDLSTYVDIDQMRQDFSPYLVSLGIVDRAGGWPGTNGGLFGGMIRLASKSRIWYPTPEFEEAGYRIPGTWEDLLVLSDQMVSDGQAPWCWGEYSDEYSGWPGTDWIEDLIIRAGGPAVYDEWVSGDRPFTDPMVVDAFERLGEIVFHDRYLYRGSEGALRQYPWHAITDLTWDPPECWLFHYPSYGAEDVPSGAATFPTPTIAEAGRSAVIGGGDMAVVFSDRPEVRSFVKFLFGPEFGREWADNHVGFISARSDFDLDSYTFWGEPNEVIRPIAASVRAALIDDTFRFDGSDLMPPEVGMLPFYSAMLSYIGEGPDNLDELLAGLDAAWPDR